MKRDMATSGRRFVSRMSQKVNIFRDVFKFIKVDIDRVD
jgi:hypothetical protein